MAKLPEGFATALQKEVRPANGGGRAHWTTKLSPDVLEALEIIRAAWRAGELQAGQLCVFRTCKRLYNIPCSRVRFGVWLKGKEYGEISQRSD